MDDATPSRTAYRVALRRAAHQVFDRPVVFQDPLALRIVGMTEQHVRSGELRAPKRASSRSLRAFLVARSRFAEDTLRAAVQKGARQYVLLGAGLDTFAYRNVWPELQVFEVDHPATQAWKRDLLEASGIAVPANCRYVPVDFEQERVAERLLLSGYNPALSTVWAWLGVVPYLTGAAMHGTLQDIAAVCAHAELVLDYGLPRAMLPPEEQLALDSLSSRVHQAGEPFRQFFTPAEIAGVLKEHGWRVESDLDPEAMNETYFASREDGLRVIGRGAHLLRACRGTWGLQA